MYHTILHSHTQIYYAKCTCSFSYYTSLLFSNYIQFSLRRKRKREMNKLPRNCRWEMSATILLFLSYRHHQQRGIVCAYKTILALPLTLYFHSHTKPFFNFYIILIFFSLLTRFSYFFSSFTSFFIIQQEKNLFSHLLKHIAVRWEYIYIVREGFSVWRCAAIFFLLYGVIAVLFCTFELSSESSFAFCFN